MKIMPRSVAVLLALTLAAPLAACSSPGSGSGGSSLTPASSGGPVTVSRYVSLMAVLYPHNSRGTLVGIGHQVCGLLDKQIPPARVAAALRPSLGGNRKASIAAVDLAAAAFCPRHLPR